MNKKFIMNNSMPRSGSTLLQRILSQNPKIYASPTSSLIDILLNVRNNWYTLEHRAITHTGIPQKILPKVLKSIVEAYYSDLPTEIICDKSRANVTNLDIWESILGYKPKILICFRNLADILASMEKLHRKTSLIKQPSFEKEYYWQFQTVEQRCAIWTAPEQIIGIAYNRITDAIQRHPEVLHFIHYDKLTKFPEETMKGVYQFLGEKYFPHDFDNVPTENLEADLDVHGYENLHETRAKVQWIPSDAKKILGAMLTEKYNQFNLDILYPDIC